MHSYTAFCIQIAKGELGNIGGCKNMRPVDFLKHNILAHCIPAKSGSLVMDTYTARVTDDTVAQQIVLQFLKCHSMIQKL
jgi:hypothetical protein